MTSPVTAYTLADDTYERWGMQIDLSIRPIYYMGAQKRIATKDHAHTHPPPVIRIDYLIIINSICSENRVLHGQTIRAMSAITKRNIDKSVSIWLKTI